MADRQSRWTAPKEARMVPKEKAAYAYHETVRRRVDPALMEWAGAGVFSARVFPLTPRSHHRIVVGYDVDLLQVTVKPQEEALANTPALLLGGANDALSQFKFAGSFVEKDATYAWDIAAGMLLVEEAGGRVTDLDGGSPNLGRGVADVVASNGAIHDDLLAVVRA